MCRPFFVDLLDGTAKVRFCGPAWSYWQFLTERLFGTLSRFTRTRRLPYAVLNNAVLSKFSADLVTSFSESHVADAWEAATGNPVRRESQDPDGRFSVSTEPKLDIFPPRRASTALIGDQLERMKAVLALEGDTNIPENVFAKKYFRARLANGQVAGTVSSSEMACDSRRDHLVRINSHVRQAERRGRGEVQALARVYGAVHHFELVFIDGAPKAYAYIEGVRASADRDGA